MTDKVAEAQAAAKAEADAKAAAQAAGGEGDKTPAPGATSEGDKPADNKPAASIVEDDKGGKTPLEGSATEQVETLLKGAGLDPKEVTRIVMENDGTVTPAVFKALVEEHGEATAKVVVDNLSQFSASAKAEVTARDEAIYSQVAKAFEGVTEQSGAESWAELAAWAKDNVPNSERQEINDLLSHGGIAAEFAVKTLIDKFKSSDSFTQPALLEEGESQDTSGIKPLDKASYDRELRKLLGEGRDYNTDPDIAKLKRARSKAIARGI